MPDDTRLTWRRGIAAGLLALALSPAQAAPPDGGQPGAFPDDGSSGCIPAPSGRIRHVSRPDGALPCAAAAPAPDGWTAYTNTRYGTTIHYPRSHFRPVEGTPSDTEGRVFVGPDGLAEMRVWAGPNALHRRLTEMGTEILKTHPAARIVEQRSGVDWFTLKLELGSTILHRHILLDGGNTTHNVEIRYPTALAGRFDLVAEIVVRSLGRRAFAPPRGLRPAAPATPAEPGARQAERAHWEAIRNSPHAWDFLSYLDRWPGGPHAGEARQRLAELSAPARPGDAQMELAFWQSIAASDDPAMYEAYLAQWPDGTFAPLARLKIERLTAASAAGAGPRYHTPARGSVERRAIMDAARLPIERELGQRVIFLVSELRSDGAWCYLEAEPLTPDGGKLDWSATPYAADRANDRMSELVMVLLRRQDGGWQAVDYVIGPTDVFWYNWVDGYGLPERLFTPGN